MLEKGDYMYVIKEDIMNEMIIKHSRFITFLIKCERKKDIKALLSKIKLEYPKANHYCYAYRLYDSQGSSDDGEPSGTAGLPILNVLEKESISNILCIVVRYFGGIKLGGGGLIRAYSKSASVALSFANKEKLVLGYKIKLFFDYHQQREIDYLLKDTKVIYKNFDYMITYTILTTNLELFHSYEFIILDQLHIPINDIS